MKRATQVKTIDLTPTWTEMVNVLLVIIESGTPEGKKLAIAEMRRMAACADKWNQHCKRGTP